MAIGPDDLLPFTEEEQELMTEEEERIDGEIREGYGTFKLKVPTPSLCRELRSRYEYAGWWARLVDIDGNIYLQITMPNTRFIEKY